MTPLERIQTLAAAGNPPPTPPCGGGGAGELANILGELGRVAMSDSQTSIGGTHNNNNVNRSLRRNRFSFNGRKPSFSWLSSTSSINSTAPVKGADSFTLYIADFINLNDQVPPNHHDKSLFQFKGYSNKKREIQFKNKKRKPGS